MPGRRWALVGWPLVLVLFAVAVLLLVRDYHVARDTRAHSPIGRIAPDATVSTLDGNARRLLGAARRPTWLNFFATWCVPCKSEMPQIEQRYRRLSARGLAVVGVDQQESPDQVRRFARALGVTFPLVVDQGSAAGAYRVFALPTSVFIDAHGVIRALHVGAMSGQQMDDDLITIEGSASTAGL